MRALLRSNANLLEQACLADSGLADHLDGTWPTSFQIVEDALDAAEFVHASDEWINGYGSSIEPSFLMSRPKYLLTHAQ